MICGWIIFCQGVKYCHSFTSQCDCGFFNNRIQTDLQYLKTLAADELHVQLSHYPNSSVFFFWPTLLLSPSIRCHTSRLTSGASSLWPIILYPHWLQTITTEANSSLFPLSAVSLLIFNKKKKVFVSSMKKWCLQPLSFVHSFFTPPHIVSATAPCWSAMNL